MRRASCFIALLFNAVVFLLAVPTVCALTDAGSWNARNPDFSDIRLIGGGSSAFGFVNNGHGSLDAQFQLSTKNIVLNITAPNGNNTQRRPQHNETSVELCASIALCDFGKGITRGPFLSQKQIIYIDSVKINSAQCQGQNVSSTIVADTGCYSFLISHGKTSLKALFNDTESVPSSNSPFPARLHRYGRREKHSSGDQRANQVVTDIVLHAPLPHMRQSSNRNRIYVLAFAACVCKVRTNLSDPMVAFGRKQSSSTDEYSYNSSRETRNRLIEEEYSFKYDLHMRNLQSQYPELGWEEMWYPLGAKVVLVLNCFLVFAALCSVLVWKLFNLPWRPFPIRAVLVAVPKLLSNGLLLGYVEALIASSSARFPLAIARLPVMMFADVSMAVYVLTNCVGLDVLPSEWFFTNINIDFRVCTAIFIEGCIVLVNKVLFPYKVVGAVMFAVIGGSFLWLASSFAIENATFLSKYSHAIYAAFIVPSSTSIPGLARYFYGTAFVLLLAYFAKLAAVIAADYVLRRPDLLWITFESVDGLMLLWFILMLFPRPHFGAYVDLASMTDSQRPSAVGAQDARYGLRHLWALISRTGLRRNNRPIAGLQAGWSQQPSNGDEFDIGTRHTLRASTGVHSSESQRPARSDVQSTGRSQSTIPDRTSHPAAINSGEPGLDLELGLQTPGTVSSDRSPNEFHSGANNGERPRSEISNASGPPTNTTEDNGSERLDASSATPRYLVWRPFLRLPAQWVTWTPGMILPAPTPSMRGRQYVTAQQEQGTASARQVADARGVEPAKPLIVLGVPQNDHTRGQIFTLKLGYPLFGPAAASRQPGDGDGVADIRVATANGSSVDANGKEDAVNERNVVQHASSTSAPDLHESNAQNTFCASLLIEDSSSHNSRTSSSLSADGIIEHGDQL